MSDDLVVETRLGKLRGASESGVLAFRGVPFAASTGGTGRFAPPRPPERWSGIRDATRIGPMAPQNEPEFNLSTLPQMSEDCLNLNLFTPAADGARRPVLFYIHAGAFVSGGGGGATQNRSRLAADEDVVVVSIPANPLVVLPSFATLDLRAGVAWRRYRVDVFVRNVTDTRAYYNGSALRAFAGQSVPFTAIPIQPRTGGVTVSAKF
jgi:hypothetical protein